MLKTFCRKYLMMAVLCVLTLVIAGCEDDAKRDSSEAVNSSDKSNLTTAMQVNHRTPHTLAESFIKAVVAGDFEAVYETLSPDCRLRLDDFLAKENESRENWMARLQKLWMIRLDVNDLNSVLKDNDLYIKFEKRLTEDDKMFIQLNGKWYFVFK